MQTASTTKYKRFKREDPSERRPIELQQRDIDSIVQVADRGMLSAIQLAYLNDGIAKNKDIKRSYRERLRLLFKHEYLERYGSERMPRHLVYMLGDRGADEVIFADCPHLRPKKSYKEAAKNSSLYVDHKLMINNFSVTLGLALKGHPSARLLDAYDPDNFRDYVKLEGRRTPVIPDWPFALEEKSDYGLSPKQFPYSVAGAMR